MCTSGSMPCSDMKTAASLARLSPERLPARSEDTEIEFAREPSLPSAMGCMEPSGPSGEKISSSFPHASIATPSCFCCDAFCSCWMWPRRSSRCLVAASSVWVGLRLTGGRSENGSE